MNEQQMYDKLSREARNGYRVNELIRFSYPVRQVKLNVTVAKPLERSLEGVYRVVLQAIEAGFNTRGSLYEFLGLSPTDEFLQRELFVLKERGLVNQISGSWVLEKFGRDFLGDNKLVREEENAVFECFIDRITGKPFLMSEERLLEEASAKYLPPSDLDPPRNSGKLVERIAPDLKRIHDRSSEDGRILTGYPPEPVESDYFKWVDRWLVEYIPAHEQSGPVLLQVHKAHDQSLDNRLTERFRIEPELLMQLTDSDRAQVEADAIARFQEATFLPAITPTKRSEGDQGGAKEKLPMEPKVLTIWETKKQFEEALRSVKKRLLIESPWIKRVTGDYLQRFSSILQHDKELVILYGMAGKDEHDVEVIRQLEKLADKYPDTFHLYHLPSHLRRQGHTMTGTHRKLVIKDNDYFMLGSFNFLSMGQKEGQQVSNEQAMLVPTGVKERWSSVIQEYKLPLSTP
jgi:hypothetical protein